MSSSGNRWKEKANTLTEIGLCMQVNIQFTSNHINIMDWFVLMSIWRNSTPNAHWDVESNNGSYLEYFIINNTT